MSAYFALGSDSNNRLNLASASGQALPLIVLVLALAAVAAFLLASLGGEILRSARSQAAADASALAAAGTGERAASRVAERNGAELLSFVQKDTPQGATVTRQPVGAASSSASASSSAVSAAPAASAAAAGVEVEIRRDGWNSFAAAVFGSLRPWSSSAERRFPPRLTASPLEADLRPPGYSQSIIGSQSVGHSPAS